MALRTDSDEPYRIFTVNKNSHPKLLAPRSEAYVRADGATTRWAKHKATREWGCMCKMAGGGGAY